jgi:micrococcal nuclease
VVRYLIMGAVAMAGFATATAVAQSDTSTAAAPEIAASNVATGFVVKVIDGDTLDVRVPGGKLDRIRVLGIDSPEMQPRERCAAQATAAARRLALGKTVRLTTDPTQARRDRHQRLLAYVALPGGSDFGRRLLTGGYATVFVYRNKPFVRLPAYRAAQRAARLNGAGLWGSCSSIVPIATPLPPAPKPVPKPPVPTTTTAPPPAPTTTGTTTSPGTTTTTTTGTTTTPPPPASGCHASYPDFCIPPPPPDKDCGDFSQKNFRVDHSVANPDPHRLDGDKDGRACEN